MRGDNDIGHGDQAHKLIVLNDITGKVFVEQVAFFLVNIQAGCTDLTGFDSLNEILRVYKAAAGRVDNDDAVLHFANRFGVDQMVGILCQRAVQGNDVRLGKQFVQVYIVQPGFRSGILIPNPQQISAKTRPILPVPIIPTVFP